MANYFQRMDNYNPMRKPYRRSTKPRPISPVGAGQVATMTGTGTGTDR